MATEGRARGEARFATPHGTKLARRIDAILALPVIHMDPLS